MKEFLIGTVILLLTLPFLLIIVERSELQKENGILKAQNMELSLKLQRMCYE